MKKLPISLILIACNEEKNLPRCLDSVVPWVSEVVAVINDCSDNTRSILESYGARVYEHPWEGSMLQKNRALAYAEQPWVLSLDADEVVPGVLIHAIRDFINGTSGRYSGACFPRKTWFWGRWITHGDWYPDYVLRLFKRETGRFVGGKDHEHVSVDGAVRKIKGELMHYSFSGINDMVTKLPRFGDAHLKWQLDQGRRWSFLKTVVRAFWRFFRCYFIKRGFLDGYAGFYIACHQAFYTLFRYSRLYEHNTEVARNDS